MEPNYSEYEYEVNFLVDYAARYTKSVMKNTMTMLRAFRDTGLWKGEEGDKPIHPDDLTVGAVLGALRDILLGDAALFCMLSSRKGVDSALYDEFSEIAADMLKDAEIYLGELENSDPVHAAHAWYIYHIGLESLTHPNAEADPEDNPVANFEYVRQCIRNVAPDTPASI